MKPLKLVVLASGSGTLFQSLIDSRDELGISIDALISDVPCGANDRAKNAGIIFELVPMLDDRVEWDQNLCAVLKKFSPDLIVSAGFMRIIGPAVLAEFQGRIINTHPALLPLFPGAHAVRDALAAGATETGSTIHFVDSGMDTGPVIAQQAIDILPTDTEESLHERIKKVERELLVNTVREFIAGSIHYPESSRS